MFCHMLYQNLSNDLYKFQFHDMILCRFCVLFPVYISYNTWFLFYQVYQSKYGFLPNLSILDLLFNEGNEAVFFL